ncbi:hypothetical protein Tco_0822190 [Tanacetum coccineum]|uniref:NADPH:adrenodoxin oxidoreductase, mitochondrial n=1 Tax=Tanacetum coccineum TaxID=301880 RepID=A0ABQ5AIK6_9ASTR
MHTLVDIRGIVVPSSDDAQTKDGLYVFGWLKRGPTGIIATNLSDAEETVASISEDFVKKELKLPRQSQAEKDLVGYWKIGAFLLLHSVIGKR